ncbi:MAG: tryptophanase [Candidatus Nanohaloarchaeota archaeon QJJ-5]|nr:tryptophanase [Candidatus Nanohaloarchaeota archaeon QJJ-5]
MRNYRFGMVETIECPSRDVRERQLAAANFNTYRLDAEHVYLDLLTDSGTGPLSKEQWSAMMTADESYAGSKSFRDLETYIQETFGFDHVIPTHQGRAAEHVLFRALLEENDHVPNNTHFATTEAQIKDNDAIPVNCPIEAGRSTEHDTFKGNIDPAKVAAVIEQVGTEHVPAIMLALTNNALAGQPVSMDNIKTTRDLADQHDRYFIIDACRYVENAYFIQHHEDGQQHRELPAIAKEQLQHADIITMSGKKNGLVNMGGFVALDDDELAEAIKEQTMLHEGFYTYGGMSGRTMEAFRIGLQEALTPRFIEQRVEQTQDLGQLLEDRGIPLYKPVSGHAVYINASAFLDHLDVDDHPAEALAAAFYLEGGIRTSPDGTLPYDDSHDALLRLCLPPRTYHRDHLEDIAETAATLLEDSNQIPGLEITKEPDHESLAPFQRSYHPRSL